MVLTFILLPFTKYSKCWKMKFFFLYEINSTWIFGCIFSQLKQGYFFLFIVHDAFNDQKICIHSYIKTCLPYLRVKWRCTYCMFNEYFFCLCLNLLFFLSRIFYVAIPLSSVCGVWVAKKIYIFLNFLCVF